MKKNKLQTDKTPWCYSNVRQFLNDFDMYDFP